jgi:hypothetical protein
MWHVWETEKVQTKLWWGNLREVYHSEDVGISGRLLLKLILKKWGQRHLPQDGGMWQAVVNAVMNVRVP